MWEQYAGRLRSWLRSRLGNEADAEDVLQEVFLRAHQRLDQLRDEERIAGWLHQIARNAVTGHFRRRPAAAPADELEAVAPDEPSSADAALGAWVAAEVQNLPEPYREALELTELGDLNQREAAERLGISHSGLKSRVQRGRAQLRERLAACCRVTLDARGGVLEVQPRSPASPRADCCSS